MKSVKGGMVLIECRGCKLLVRGPWGSSFSCPKCQALLQRSGAAAKAERKKRFLYEAKAEALEKKGKKRGRRS